QMPWFKRPPFVPALVIRCRAAGQDFAQVPDQTDHRHRRTYTRDFKLAAVKLLTIDGRSVTEAARSPGLSENLLHVWKQKLQAEGQAFPGRSTLSPLEDEVRRLRAENKRLQMERDTRKKATAFFAAEAT